MQFQQQQQQLLQSSRAMQYSLDTASAQVLTAWENAQRHVHHQHRNTYNFPISPASSASSSSSPTSSMQWPSLMSEQELRGLISGAAMAVTDPAANHHHQQQQQFFDFDFTLPHLHFQQQLPHSTNSALLRTSPPLPTPTTPSSSSSSALYATPPVSPTSNMHFHDSESPVSPPHALKRSSSSHSDYSSTGAATTGSGSTKKARACMSMKDFVPPDVTGMSKREARLVKNRAAAFLSRQRKREEFELMEVRVAELEQENARLRDLADNFSPPASSPSDSSSKHSSSIELEVLRLQLSASRSREAELKRQLDTFQQQKEQGVKAELYEPVLGSEGTSSGANSPLLAASTLKNVVANPKGGASLGLMVLLCALPSLLSHPSSQPRSTLPTSQSFLDTIQWDAPAFFPASTSTTDDVPSWDLDYPNSGPAQGAHANMDMDVDFSQMHNNQNEGDEWKKLELGLEGTDDMGLKDLGLGALDISFATRRTKDGKVRVRVHSSPSHSSAASTSTAPLSAAPPSFLPIDPALLTSSPNIGKDAANPLALSYVDADPLGPFLGAGSSSPSPPSAPFDIAHSLSSAFASGAPWVASSTASESSGETRRVRIALKGLPQPGGEGGEWEIEVR